MLHSFASNFADFLMKNTKSEGVNKEVIIYGIELVVSSIINMIIILIIGYVFNKFIATILFLLCYCSLRRYAGGIHASSYWSCSFIFSTYYVIWMLLDLNTLKGYQIVVLLFSSFVILYFSPVEDLNKIVSINRKRKIAKKAKIMLISEIVLYVMFLLFDFNNLYCLTIVFALFSEALFLILGIIKNSYKGGTVNNV